MTKTKKESRSTIIIMNTWQYVIECLYWINTSNTTTATKKKKMNKGVNFINDRQQQLIHTLFFFGVNLFISIFFAYYDDDELQSFSTHTHTHYYRPTFYNLSHSVFFWNFEIHHHHHHYFPQAMQISCMCLCMFFFEKMNIHTSHVHTHRWMDVIYFHFFSLFFTHTQIKIALNQSMIEMNKKKVEIHRINMCACEQCFFFSWLVKK